MRTVEEWRSRFNYVYSTAKNTKGMNAKETISFQWQNPNGLWAEVTALKGRIKQLVELKKVKSGWLIAYDFDWEWERMYKLCSMEKPRWRSIRVWESMLRETLDKVEFNTTKAEGGE